MSLFYFSNMAASFALQRTRKNGDRFIYLKIPNVDPSPPGNAQADCGDFTPGDLQARRVLEGYRTRKWGPA